MQRFHYSADCSGRVEGEWEFPIGSCIEGEFLGKPSWFRIEAPHCQGSDSSAKRVNVPVSMGYVLLGLFAFLGQAVP